MSFEFRMKTGFYETKTYDLLIRKGKLILSPIGPDDPLIKIPEDVTLEITLKKGKKSLEMEIQTNERIYQGLLINKTNYELLLEQLKENINKKIVCEYKGGY